jgi:hypothetical protein
MKLTNRSYSATVRTFVPSEVTSPLSMKDVYEQNTKKFVFEENIQIIDRKISNLSLKYERSMLKTFVFKDSKN